ncbi:MAG TPA: D-Ala-D-Ala carboxypeptidase family metallohydrolase [Devosia sp.]|jgi:zinc D-Ala-D-Ala carboxypeptidase|nr:D-Ala-D-Ala carboxypeptidase family metallohydrolase [Devosia sp.]
MRRLLFALCSALTLSACALSPPRDLYDGYSVNFGMYTANSGVDTFCFVPQLRLALLSIESHFGRKVVVTSGYRDPIHNIIVGGKGESYHMRCMASDIFIPGIDKSRLIAFAYSNPLIGGMGCYPGQGFVHIDVRQRPPGWTHPVTFSGC